MPTGAGSEVKARDKLKSTGCPVTSINVNHADDSWIKPMLGKARSRENLAMSTKNITLSSKTLKGE